MSKPLMVNRMVRIKELACALVPDELALKAFNLELRYKNIPEKLGCATREGLPKETCFKLTPNTRVCIVSKE
jgi:hypothetical protein